MTFYELAKELKTAGFPQIGDSRFCYLDGTHISRKMLFPEGNPIYMPTLSELIEACGEDFDALFSNYSSLTVEARGMWRADATNRTGYSVIGNSPEEAVARLWLALKGDK